MMTSPKNRELRGNAKLSSTSDKHHQTAKLAEEASSNDNNDDESEHFPQILSRNTNLPHVANLDAGDVVEVYTLMRMAKLENGPMAPYRYLRETADASSESNGAGAGGGGGGGDNNNKDSHPSKDLHIPVLKHALAFRYKPKSTSPDATFKSPFELTLEYGPQRAGATQAYEAVPIVNGRGGGSKSGGGSGSGDGNNRRDRVEDGANMYLSWENHAKIYYSLSIKEQEWTSAYYMAPITGAVLDKILDYIQDYPINHPRYQPFTVMAKSSNNNQRPILKSSNSEDFVYNVFDKLAEWYVAIEPVLTPNRYSLQIHVEDAARDVERVGGQHMIDVYDDSKDGGSNNNNKSNSSGEKDDKTEKRPKQNIANAAAQFYQRLYSCIGAIETGDYSAFEPKVTEAPSSMPSTSPSSISTEPPTSEPSHFPNHIQKFNSTPSSNATTTDDEHLLTGHKNITEDDPERKNEIDLDRNIRFLIDTSVDSDDEEIEDDDTDEHDDYYSEPKRDNGTDNDNISAEDYYTHGGDESSENKKDDNPKKDDDDNDESPMHHVDDAKNAAEEAQKAAEEAKEAAESMEDNKAAEAAEHAAKAAKKAAKATSEAADEATKENLLSGDGALSTSVISTCFSDPKYHIQRERIISDDQLDEDPLVATDTYAYLYLDGTSYFRLNVTAPYLTVVPVTQPLPEPNYIPEGKGDVIDFALAFAIIGGFCFGILVMLHNIGLLNLDRRLRFRGFFQPHHHNNSSSSHGKKKYQSAPTNESSNYDDEKFSFRPHCFGESKTFESNDMLDTNMTEEGMDDYLDSRLRNDRQPNMVELPELRSKSKVAIPSSHNGDFIQ